jgi:glycosyltransferase involved in cell wall biosynthesis
MHIFHLVPNLDYGGLQEVVRGLALCQLRSGHTLTIGCWTNEGNHPESERELREAGARIVYLRRASDGSLFYDRLSLLSALKGYLGADNADILHVHNPFDYYFYGAIAARVVGGTAIVHTLHATIMFDSRARMAAGAKRLKVERTKAEFWIAAMLTNAQVSVCSEAEAVVRSKFFLPGKRFYVVENGLDLKPFLAVPSRPPRAEIVFGAVGRMSFEKNHRCLIEAFALAHRKEGNIRLRLLGGGPLEPNLKEQVRQLGLDKVVDFCGFSHEVARFLAGLDVFVLPSISEAMPLSLLEAIASGLPVVATAVGGVPRIVRSTGSGWVCQPRDSEALRAALELAIACQDRRKRGEQARQSVVQLYSAERMARDYERIYQEVCFVRRPIKIATSI